MKKSLMIVAGATATTLALAACGAGEGEDATDTAGGTTTLRVAFNQPENHPQYIAMTNMGERLEERTDGAYSIEVYPNETLGAQGDTIQLLQDRSIEMSIVVGGLLENLSEDFVVFNLPYMFDDQAHQREIANDPQVIGDLYTSLEESNVTVLGAFPGGARSVYNSIKPIRTPEDLDAMKIRVQESDTHIGMINLMGGSATPMAFGEVYSALQSGVLDGAENAEVGYSDMKHVEVAPYFSYTRHLIVPDYILMGTGVLSQMSEEHRAIFDEELATAIAEEGEFFTSATEDAIAEAEAAGAQFNDDVDIDAFREILEPFQEESVPDTDQARALYEAIRN